MCCMSGVRVLWEQEVVVRKLKNKMDERTMNRQGRLPLD